MFHREAVAKHLRSLLACPACLAPKISSQARQGESFAYLQCSHCRRIYPFNNFGVIDFQVYDMILRIPEHYLGMWALAQLNALEEYKTRSPGSVALPESQAAQSFASFMTLASQTVLDLGSGLDYIPGYVADQRMSHYIALDPLPLEATVPFERIQGWAECMPFIDDSFDAVIMGTSLDHLLCLESALSEAYRVLKAGGDLYIWGAWFADDTFFRNIAERPFFQRPPERVFAEDQALDAFQRDRGMFQEATSDHATLQERYAGYLVDKWHFRHIPLRFIKSMRRRGFQIESMDVWEWNYHENHVFLNGFVKLRKRRVAHAIDQAESAVLRHLDIMSLMAHAVDRLLSLTQAVNGMQEGSRTALIQEMERMRAMTDTWQKDLHAFSSRLESSMESLHAKITGMAQGIADISDRLDKKP